MGRDQVSAAHRNFLGVCFDVNSVLFFIQEMSTSWYRCHRRSLSIVRASYKSLNLKQFVRLGITLSLSLSSQNRAIRSGTCLWVRCSGISMVAAVASLLVSATICASRLDGVANSKQKIASSSSYCRRVLKLDPVSCLWLSGFQNQVSKNPAMALRHRRVLGLTQLTKYQTTGSRYQPELNCDCNRSGYCRNR